MMWTSGTLWMVVANEIVLLTLDIKIKCKNKS
jgi:hypothetical protein